MISTAFVYLAAYIVSTILFVFPQSSGLSTQATSAIASLGGYVGMFNPLIPIDTVLQIILLVISFELAVFGFRAFRWLFSHVPLVGGKST